MMRVYNARPDPAWVTHREAVVALTLRRKVDLVRGSLDPDADGVARAQQALREKFDRMGGYLNGDYTKRQVAHWHLPGECKVRGVPDNVDTVKQNTYA